jgi:hypothetical protein
VIGRGEGEGRRNKVGDTDLGDEVFGMCGAGRRVGWSEMEG